MIEPARLSPAALSRLPQNVARPDYDRDAQAVGIVHFGIGAFHRAHQAWYTDAAMRGGERDWMILGVSLRSADVAQQMNPQAGLYSVIERSAEGAGARIVGSVRGVLVARDEPAAVIAAVAAPTTKIVSLTITEKGYCRTAAGDLDPMAADEGSVFRFLAQGLRRRCDAGLPGLTLLSCDNLADNGHHLQRLMHQYLARHDPALLEWFAAACTCPSTTAPSAFWPSPSDASPEAAAALVFRTAVKERSSSLTVVPVAFVHTVWSDRKSDGQRERACVKGGGGGEKGGNCEKTEVDRQRMCTGMLAACRDSRFVRSRCLCFIQRNVLKNQ